MMSDITVHRILNLIPFAQGKIRKKYILDLRFHWTNLFL